MKTIVAGALVLFLASMPVLSQETTGQSEWKSYGKGVEIEKVTPLKMLFPKGKALFQKEIVVKGVVSEVCQTRGCWMVVEDGGSEVRVEFENYGFFVPWDSKGKRVKVQGYVREKTVSSAAAKHMAEEMKNPPVEQDKIQDQQAITIFLAKGVSMEGGGDISRQQLEVIHSEHEHHDDE